MKTDWTLETAQQQLQSCAFICDGGPLENNIAYQWLVNTLAALQAENAELREKAQSDAFIRITELIGEMGWGIGIPSPVIIKYCDLSGEIKTKCCEPREMEPVFNAIYLKLKEARAYNPMPKLREENAQLERKLSTLRESMRSRYIYPKEGEQMGDLQPGLEYYSDERREWVPSGIVSAIYRESDGQRYRAKLPLPKPPEDGDNGEGGQ